MGVRPSDVLAAIHRPSQQAEHKVGCGPIQVVRRALTTVTAACVCQAAGGQQATVRTAVPRPRQLPPGRQHGLWALCGADAAVRAHGVSGTLAVLVLASRAGRAVGYLNDTAAACCKQERSVPAHHGRVPPASVRADGVCLGPGRQRRPPVGRRQLRDTSEPGGRVRPAGAGKVPACCTQRRTTPPRSRSVVTRLTLVRGKR